MANLTIFGLVQLTSAGADLANDLVPVWDNSVSETKKMTLSDLRNLMSPVNWSDSFSSATQATSSWTPNNAAANVNAAIRPKGTGALLSDIPDGTATGGNARGTYAVDLQHLRTAADQVASGTYSGILSGYRNRISSTRTNINSVIGGGQNNVISQLNSSTIAGGINNTIGDNDGWECTIGGGGSNTITGRLASTIVGGNSNSTNNNFVTLGGRANTANGETSTCMGGQGNTASGSYASIIGGQSNTASGANWATVGGGYGNSASANGNVVAGGYANNCAGSGYSAIVGGESNSLSSQVYGFIGAGQSNNNAASYAVICGGRNNSVSAGSPDGTIGGGQSNTIFNSSWTVIGGGQSNSSNPGAGQSNQHNVIAGGLNNISNSNLQSYTKIPGGAYANASLYGQLAHASGRFAATGDAQAHELIWRRAITGTAQTELFLDGASIAAILPGTNSVWNGIIDVTAICTVTGNGTTVVGHVDATSYKVTIKRIGTTTSLVGGVQEIGITNADASMATSAFTIDNNDTNESLRVQFTPPTTAGSTTVIRAIATFRGQQIQY
jgi:hypothetical protein